MKARKARSKSRPLSFAVAGQVVRNVRALDKMIGTDGYACCGRVTMADCALTPALFLIENVLPATGVDNPNEAMVPSGEARDPRRRR